MKNFKPHMMYDPKTGKAVEAKTYQQHLQLKEKGYSNNRPIPPGLVSQLESEYKSGMPQLEDKYGRPLDVADSSNFPKYNPGRR